MKTMKSKTISRKKMDAPPAPNPDIFDVQRIRRLVELMKEFELGELDLQQGEVRVQLRRACAAVQPAALSAAPMPMAYLPGLAAPAPAAKSSEASPPKADGFAVIRSPMVGTFYTAPDPESPPFVKVGDHIGPETVVCIVEAMKVFNQIPAEIAGKVIAVLAENGAPIEFGQPLFKVETGV
jgi:acetyl-CoA carboxylase biotin carboxyl carrier protein